MKLVADGTNDDFDTERWLISAKLSGVIEANDWIIRPAVSVSYLEETQLAYTDDFNQTIGEQRFSVGELRFGPSFAREVVRDNGTVIRPKLGITGVWNFDIENGAAGTTGSLGTEQLRARIDAGLTIIGSNSWSLDVNGYFDGLGVDDYDAYGGTAKFSVALPR